MRAPFFFVVTLILLCSTFFVSRAQVQWEYMGGPRGSSVRTVAASPGGTILALTTGRNVHVNYFNLYRTQDGGLSWTHLENLPENLTGVLVYNDQGVLYAGTYSGLYTSSDDGETFGLVSATQGFGVAGIVFGNDGRSMLVKSTVAKGQSSRVGYVYYSPDMGQSFHRLEIPDDTSGLLIKDAIVNSQGVIFAAVSNSSYYLNSRLYMTNDEGAHWTELGAGALQNPSFITIRDDDALFVFDSRGMHISTDNGATWARQGKAVQLDAWGTRLWYDGASEFITITRDDDQHLPDSDRLVHSTDTMSSISYDIGLPYTANSFNFSFSADRTLYAATEYGMFIRDSVNAGWRYVEILRSDTAEVYSVFPLDNGSVLVTSSSIPYRADASGKLWQPLLFDGFPVKLRGFVQGKGDTVVACYAGWVSLSGDNGITWHEQFPIGNLIAYYFCSDTNGTIYASPETWENGGFVSLAPIFSTDNGRSWTAIDTGQIGNSFTEIQADQKGNVYREGWRFHVNGDPPKYITPANPNYIYVAPNDDLYMATQTKLYLSTNQGDGWTDTQHPKNGKFDMMTANSRSQLCTVNYAEQNPATYGSVWFNGGPGWNWQEITGSLTIDDGGHLAFDNQDRLYFGCNEGLYRTTEAVLPVRPLPVAAGADLPRTYPNPVSSGQDAVVTFGLERAGNVSVSLYSILGVEVRSATLGQKSSGRHEYTLPTRGLAPGVYQVVIRGTGDVKTGRVVVR